MKKFILPVINLIALVLSGVIFGLGANSAIYRGEVSNGQGNWYQLVWEIPQKLSVVAILGFFLFIAAVFFCLVAMVPFKYRKYVEACVAGLFIASGILILLTPARIYPAEYVKSASYIAMVVLSFVSGAITLVGACLEFLPEKK